MPHPALVLAALGAIGYGVASVLQAIGARAQRGTLRTVSHPAYLAGTGLDLLAWLCSLAALRTLPVFEVQGVLAGSVAVTAITARLVLGVRLGRPGVLAVALSAVALLALGTSAGPEHAAVLDAGRRAALATAVLPIAAAGWAAARARNSNACAALAGLAFGGAALCARALPRPAPGDLPATVSAALTDPLTWALAGFALAGMLLFATALEHGDTARATALMWIAEVTVPSAVGIGLLGDTIRPGHDLIAGAAVGLCLLSGWLLAAGPNPRPAGQRTGQPAGQAAGQPAA